MVNLIPWRQKQRGGEGAETLPLVRLRGEMDRLLDAFVREPFGGVDWPWAGRGGWQPAVDLSQTAEEVTVRAEIPGIDPKDLNVSITGRELVLSGEKKETSETKEQDFYRSETRYGSFHRSIFLPEGTDTEHVDAQYANGVLTLKLKKSPQFAPKKIKIKT
jgi:HSP20 family protein